MSSTCSRSKQDAGIGWTDIYGNRSCRWRRAGKPLIARDCTMMVDVQLGSLLEGSFADRHDEPRFVGHSRVSRRIHQGVSYRTRAHAIAAIGF